MKLILDQFQTPPSIGRIPHKIGSSFSSFTADQWKNWTLYFSLFSLRNVLPQNQLKCWQFFVLACSYTCTPVITLDCLSEGHLYFMKFLEAFEEIYGEHFVTLNIHLHQHLKDCILDYGPAYRFWLFRFERFNGMLGNYHTNQKAIEISIMRRFLDDATIFMSVHTDSIVAEHHDIFSQLFTSLNRGTADHLIDDNNLLNQENIDCPTSGIKPCPPFQQCSFESNIINILKESYSMFVPDFNEDNISSMYEKFNSINFYGDRIGSFTSRLQRTSIVLANWAGINGSINTSSNDTQPCLIEFFFQQSVPKSLGQINVTMAKVKWFAIYHGCHSLETPLEQFLFDEYEQLGASIFMPVSQIKNLCCFTTTKTDLGEKLIIICPLIKNLHEQM